MGYCIESGTTPEIGGQQLAFSRNVRDDVRLRRSFNDLTLETFGFSLEAWYQAGFWQDRYIPYVFVLEEKVLSNVSVNLMDFMVDGSFYRAMQIGTVMTAKAHRGQGLSRKLMERVLEDYAGRCDLIYLFANESVKNFYPKFGFTVCEETEFLGHFTGGAVGIPLRKLNMDDEGDRAILLRLIAESAPTARVHMVGNPGLVMFYCLSSYSQGIYYSDALDLAAVAIWEGDTMRLQGVFSPKAFDLEKVIQALIDQEGITSECVRVILGFTPLDSAPFVARPLAMGDLTLYIRGKNILDQAMFPVLSHA